jgi:hypothetical protein
MNNAKTNRIIFDNGGGCTLQLSGWAHYYEDPRDAAHDLSLWLESPNTEGWEGSEPEAMSCDPTADEIGRGGYRVAELPGGSSRLSVVQTIAHWDSWRNVGIMLAHLT